MFTDFHVSNAKVTNLCDRITSYYLIELFDWIGPHFIVYVADASKSFLGTERLQNPCKWNVF